MPCYDPDAHHDIEEIRAVQKIADERTDMLCRVCKVMEEFNILGKLPNDVFAWYREHKEWDKKRKCK